MPEVKLRSARGREYEDRGKKGGKERKRVKGREGSVNEKRRKLMHSLCKTAEARR